MAIANLLVNIAQLVVGVIALGILNPAQVTGLSAMTQGPAETITQCRPPRRAACGWTGKSLIQVYADDRYIAHNRKQRTFQVCDVRGVIL